MGQLGKQHKIRPNNWACPLFSIPNVTVALVGTNIDNYDMQLATPIFAPPYS